MGRTDWVRPVDLSRDIQYAVSGCDVKSGIPGMVLQLVTLSRGTLALCGQSLAPLMGGTLFLDLRIWDTKTGASVSKHLKEHTGSALSVAHSANG